MARRTAQGVDDQLFGQEGAIILQQKAGVANRLGRRGIRRLHRAGQEVARQFPVAIARMRLGHQGQGLGILGREIENGAQPRNRNIGAILLDQPRRQHLQRVDLAGIQFHGLFHQRARARDVAIRQQHAGQRDPGIACGAGGKPLLPQKRAQRRDRFIRLAHVEQKTRTQDTEGRGLLLGGDDPVELGHGGLRAFIREPELHQRLKRLVTLARVVARRVGKLLKKRAREVDLVTREIGLQDHRRQGFVLGKQRHHLAQGGDDIILALKPREHLHPDIVQPPIVGIRHEAALKQRKRLFVGTVAHQTVDHQPLQQPVVGIVGKKRTRPGRRRLRGPPRPRPRRHRDRPG
jgi:hypothetical protein